MKTSKLKQKLHDAIDIIEDPVILESIYNLLLYPSSLNSLTLSKGQWKMIEKRSKQFKEGKLKTTNRKKIREKALSAIKK